MSKLLENTYLAYEQFMEGELNQYDLASLIEEGIISGEVLESMVEEGYDPVKNAYKDMKSKIKNMRHGSLASKYDSIHNFVNSGSSVMSRYKLHKSLPDLGVPSTLLNKDHTGSFTDRVFNEKTANMINRFHKRDY